MNTGLGGQPVCLSIGGSDSCSGAGIQADLRVFAALATHGCSVITALTAQNPATIIRIEPVSLAQLDAELHAIFDYYDVAAVKTGMLVDAEHIALIAALLPQLHTGALVIDPVLVSSSGSRLLDDGAIDTLKSALLPQATLITPNFDEADALFGKRTDYSSAEAVQALAAASDCAVLLTGGHGAGEQLIDRLCEQDGSVHAFSHPRQAWDRQQLHGTGCRLASAVTAYLARGQSVPEAVEQGIDYLQQPTS